MAAKKPSNGRKAPEPVKRESVTVARHRRARFDYEILERYQAGIALAGGEIKSVRDGRVQLQGAYARLKGNEVWIEGLNIAPYSHEGYTHLDADRARKLLLHRREIIQIKAALEEKGLTVVPLSLYITGRGLAKVEIGIGRGRKQYDKRQKIREREEGRQVARHLRHSQ